MKLFTSLVSILILSFSALNASTLTPGVLKWAADAESNAPFIFQDPKSPTDLIGFEIEIVKELAKELNLKPVFVQNQWDGLIPGLERKDYDIAINGLEITEDRKGEVLFSNPYYITYEQLIVLSGNEKINDMSDLKGKKAGALKFSLAERILNSYGGINVSSYEGEINAFEDLKNERIDGALVDAPIALYYASWNPTFQLAGKPAGRILYGIAIRKDNTMLHSDINEALKRITEDGRLRNIYEKWNLWNKYMTEYTGDYTEYSGKRDGYDNYVKAQSKVTGTAQLIQRYISFLPLLGKGALMTLQITILAMLLAIFAGLVIALVRVYAPSPLSALAVAYIEIIRGTPLLIQLFFIFYAMPAIGIKLSPFIAAVLGLGLNYAAYEAENYRAGLFAVPRGQMEAALSLGMKRRQALRYIIIPQAVRLVIPPITNDFISLLKDSSLVSVITMVELTKVYGQLASTYYDYIGTGIIVAAIYLLLGLPFVKLSRYAEKKLALDKMRQN